MSQTSCGLGSEVAIRKPHDLKLINRNDAVSQQNRRSVKNRSARVFPLDQQHEAAVMVEFVVRAPVGHGGNHEQAETGLKGPVVGAMS